MLIIMANLAPNELLVQQVEDALAEYKEATMLNKSEKEMEDEFRKLGFACLLILCKINGEGRSPMDIIKDMDQIGKLHNMMNPNKG